MTAIDPTSDEPTGQLHDPANVAMREPCEHHWAYHVRGGEPLDVGICTLCQAINWPDLRRQYDAAVHLTEQPAELRTPDEWQREITDMVIYDPDGWRGANGRSWTDPISRDEYLARRAASTVGPLRPEPSPIATGCTHAHALPTGKTNGTTSLLWCSDCKETFAWAPPPASIDLHWVAAEAYAQATWPGLHVDRLVEHPGIRAAVDEAVRLTEQRVRAEAEATLTLMEGAATVTIDGLTGERDDWKARCEQAWIQLDQAEADLAAMTACAESAEARYDEVKCEMNNRIMAAIHAKTLGYFWLPCPLCGEHFGGQEWADVDGLPSSIPTDHPRTFQGICPKCTKAGKGKRWNETNEEWAARVNAGIGPLSAPSATVSADEASVVPVDGSDGPGGSEGDSGGAR